MSPEPEVEPEVSVVIPTHDRRDALRRTLDALGRQDFPPARFEVVVSADGCRDGTAEMARGIPMPCRLTVVESHPAAGAGAARNAGASRARGALIVFLDDDIEVAPGFVAAHAAAHAAGDRGGAGGVVAIGRLVTRLEGPARDGLFAVTLRRYWDGLFRDMAEPGHRFRFTDLLSGNFSVTAGRFRAIGGFDASLPCREDHEFGARLLDAGAAFRFCADALGVHHEATTLDRALARKRAEGRADVRIAARHPHLRPALTLAELEGYCRAPGGSGAVPLRRHLFAAANRAVRDGALRRPRAGAAGALAMRRALDALEAARAPTPWRVLLQALMAYHYWRGVAAEVGGAGGPWGQEDEVAAADGAETGGAAAFALDLSEGVATAASALDRARPAGARVLFGTQALGELPAVAGAEPLRGAHLRAALAGRPLGEAYLRALALAAAGDADDGAGVPVGAGRGA